MTELSRNARVLRYLVGAAPGLGHTLLAKFAYLADHEARRYLGRPVTDFCYVWDNFGPFDSQAFYAALRELHTADAIVKQHVRFPNGMVGYQINPTETTIEYGFDAADAEILRLIVDTFAGTSVRELCEGIVYKTKPMKSVKARGEVLPMEELDNEERFPGGFDLETLLESERQAAAGHHRPFSQALRERLTPRN